VLVGQFQVSLVAPIPASGSTPETPGHTTLVGKVSDGPTPQLIVWEEAAQDGSCKLLTPRVPYCSQTCSGGSVCVENEKCQKYPSARSIGTVQAKGLKTVSGATEFSMDPVANNYQPPTSVTLAYPAFAEGDSIRLEASGGSFAAFTLQAQGITSLTLPSDTISLAENQAVSLTWAPPGKADIAKIQVKLDISHHGGTKGKIECEAADSGSLQLSASLVTQLLKLGVAGFPTIVVTRSAVGSATISAGRLDLVISSEVEKAVTIPGLNSCNKDTDCPDNQKCQPDLTCK
jgi:hypothetical protein